MVELATAGLECQVKREGLMHPRKFAFACFQRDRCVMDCRPDIICLWEKYPYLSLWPRGSFYYGSLCITPVSLLSISKSTLKIHQIHTKKLLLSSSVFRLTGVKGRMLCQKENVPEGRNMWKTCFLFHHCRVDLPFHIPHKRFHHEVTHPQPISSPTPPLLTDTFRDPLTSSSTSQKKESSIMAAPPSPNDCPVPPSLLPNDCQIHQLIS